MMKNQLILAAFLAVLSACGSKNPGLTDQGNLKKEILADTSLQQVKLKAVEIVKGGFNAGDHYGEVWIRDYNTFITLATEIHPQDSLKKMLKTFFYFQGKDGNIVDGFIRKPKNGPDPVGYAYIYSDLAPGYAAHKNTVETDQETSLVQAIYKYVVKTGDKQFLLDTIAGSTVQQRMEQAMDFLMKHRYNEKYGLIWGATTADWGDVQPEHSWGVVLDENSHLAIDIYDNAMFLVALDNLMALNEKSAARWKPIRKQIAENTMQYLWDEKNQKFIPHIYLKDSPFPKDFDENAIYYHGGTTIAMEANLLSKDQIKTSLDKMISNVQKSGAGSIGLTLYPTYPEGSFKNKGMYPYGYQNGGDWTWFGARTIQQLIRNGFEKEAYEQLKPMIDRVIVNKGFFEWYTVDNKPNGSGTFRGSAGVLYDAINMLEVYASKDK